MNKMNVIELFLYTKREDGIAACFALYIVGKISELNSYKNDEDHNNDGGQHCHLYNGN